jgi:glycosyltransferase involved in cell wall biosynthesis
MASRLGITDRVSQIPSASPESLARLYANAHACLALSACESFGLPLLEAMRAGLPAIVADEPWSREMAGDAAIRVDATEPAAIANAVRALSDRREWERRSLWGRQVAGRFTWAQTASALADVAATLIGR